MRILIVGDFEFSIYESALYNAFLKRGYEASKFEIKPSIRFNRIVKLLWRVENKYAFGTFIRAINRRLINCVSEVKPDMIFVYRGRQIFPKTYLKVRKCIPDAKLLYYNNDDPFSNSYASFFWRHVRSSIQTFDHIFCYREKNMVDIQKLGYNHTSILRSYFIEDENFQFNEDFEKRNIDVVFIGHYEDDGRDDMIKEIIDNGINLKLYGTGWGKSKHYNFFVLKYGDISPITGWEYNTVLNFSKIALVFFSKRNNDSYTRRCFEIPAAGCVMLSEYTIEMENLFIPDMEAAYFTSVNELLEKLKSLLSDLKRIENIAAKASKRLIHDKHEVQNRVDEIVSVFKTL